MTSDAAPANRKLKLDSVGRLLKQQEDVLHACEAMRELMKHYQERKCALKDKEIQLKVKRSERDKAEAYVDLALKNVQLEAAQREAAVQPLLARKTLQDSGIGQQEIDLRLPLTLAE